MPAKKSDTALSETTGLLPPVGIKAANGPGRGFRAAFIVAPVGALLVAAMVGNALLPEMSPWRITGGGGHANIDPKGPYSLVQVQEGEGLLDSYDFFDGPDNVGSGGYVTYVNRSSAMDSGIMKVTEEVDTSYSEDPILSGKDAGSGNKTKFLYMGSAPTDAGPREAIRLEGKTRFNRGLYVIDLHHMPAGCGTWPAIWLSDEENWPVNGEIDIIEGVNYQTAAKTALHTHKGCDMSDVSDNAKTGGWDPAVGIPNGKTGIPDMTPRNATNCYVYAKHQWTNQGCVAVAEEGTIGEPINDVGGGVFALEWDPYYGHIRTWAFVPHGNVPEDLKASILAGGKGSSPDPDSWGKPYGVFPIGKGTGCPKKHFQNMHLIINLAFCGAVAGERYWMDCPNKFKQFKTCQEYIKSDPEELNEAYWKIKGIYVYQRELE